MHAAKSACTAMSTSSDIYMDKSMLSMKSMQGCCGCHRWTETLAKWRVIRYTSLQPNWFAIVQLRYGIGCGASVFFCWCNRRTTIYVRHHPCLMKRHKHETRSRIGDFFFLLVFFFLSPGINKIVLYQVLDFNWPIGIDRASFILLISLHSFRFGGISINYCSILWRDERIKRCSVFGVGCPISKCGR